MYLLIIPLTVGCSGNYKGVSPYVKGSSCSACPEGYGTCDNKLCRKFDVFVLGYP